MAVKRTWRTKGVNPPVSQQDFLRRLPESDRALRKRDRLQQRLHIDFWLLLLLLSISAGGLVVLFSASDQSVAVIKRQGFYFALAYGVLIRSEERRVGKECRARWSL